MRTLKFIDLFCGAGGLSLGLVRAGLEPVFAIDNDPWAIRTYQANFGQSLAFCGDIAKWAAYRDADVIIGGPPCQGFSRLGKRNTESPLNYLWAQYSRAVAEVHPLAFVMENVPELLRSEHYLKFKAEISSDYALVERVLNAADYGVPQTRKRAFVFGSRIGAAEKLVPNPTHGLTSKGLLYVRPWRTVRDAFRTEILGRPIPNDPSFPPDVEWDDDEPKAAEALHVDRRAEPRTRERYTHIPEGGNRHDLGKVRPDLVFDCWKDENGEILTQGRHDGLGRMYWDKPSPTIRTDCRPEKGRFLHPEADRGITSWEAARLQTFPDNFAFAGPRTHVSRQIGNAVPVLLAEAIGRSVAQV